MSELAWKILLDVLLLFWSAFLASRAKSTEQKVVGAVAFLLVLGLFLYRLSKL